MDIGYMKIITATRILSRVRSEFKGIHVMVIFTPIGPKIYNHSSLTGISIFTCYSI